ncbi:aminotransferase class V-fold PLP-dependent enzyme [Rhizobium leguminosarum]|uniref:aminotransferase class V-fold PLP-dependent enzyme n=1 Tax=Rhizobium leguminosarum TaxID=384 RepID=UPI003F996BA9
MTSDIISELRNDIPYIHDKIYLDNAAVTPVPKRVQAAGNLHDKIVSENLRNYCSVLQPIIENGRALAAKLVGSQAENIAYVQNTAHGLSLVALGLDWREGDNVVVCADEFPSNYLCWLQLAERGVEVRRVSSRDGRVEVNDVRSMIDSRTRIVAVSHVQFYSGFRVDIGGLGEICRRADTLLVVDGTQSIGAIRLDVEDSGVDVLVVAAHKWMMGPRGVGFAYFSERAIASISPRVVGWLSVNEPFAFNRTLDFLPGARRYEAGTPNGAGILGLAERLAQIDKVGIDWIEARILLLSELLQKMAAQKGLELAYQFAPASASGINLLRRPGISTSEMHSRLTAAGILTSVRSNAIRIAPHYYNTAEEIEQVVAVMSASS